MTMVFRSNLSCLFPLRIITVTIAAAEQKRLRLVLSVTISDIFVSLGTFTQKSFQSIDFF